MVFWLFYALWAPASDTAISVWLQQATRAYAGPGPMRAAMTRRALRLGRPAQAVLAAFLTAHAQEGNRAPPDWAEFEWFVAAAMAHAAIGAHVLVEALRVTRPAFRHAVKPAPHPLIASLGLFNDSG